MAAPGTPVPSRRSVCGWPAGGMDGSDPLTKGLSSSDTEDRRKRRACRFAMAERPAAAPAGMTAAERDALLATKLHMPAPRPGLVPRPRLAGQLDEGLARGVILVCAPAGYGKTAMLADWARRSEQPGRVAVAGRGRQRPGPVLAPRCRCAGPGSPRDRRPGCATARPADAVVVPGRGDGPDKRAGRATGCGRGAAGPRRLPRHRLPAGARLARVLAGAPAGRDLRGAGQPQ